ncbi:MAG: metalloregulator ArsR/SmtB family transcription factor [Chloroflexi bacterium]|nr:metalloregulator ArsR/SmtB family transcription factor [Chloroflexota bacterium]MDA8187061.1 metalloregulator ArsR/SmtB family transcription factor [Dehalococcoidales bacterium]
MTEVSAGVPGSIEDALELFQVLAHPVRLRLLIELCREEECVCHLAALLDRPQPYISQQLAELRQAGLVVDRRDGQRIFYRIVDQRVRSLLLASGLLIDEKRPVVSGCVCPKCA